MTTTRAPFTLHADALLQGGEILVHLRVSRCLHATTAVLQLAELLPTAGLWNLYGPTETNVCTYYLVDRVALPTMDRLPIGRACANTEVFAVDEQDRVKLSRKVAMRELAESETETVEA